MGFHFISFPRFCSIRFSYLDLTKTLRGIITLPGSGQDIAGFHFLIWIWQRHRRTSFLYLASTLQDFILTWTWPRHGRVSFHFLAWTWPRHREVLVPFLEVGQINKDCISFSGPGQENPGFRFKRMWAM